MNLHWLTIVGIVTIGIGTLFTLLGQQFNSDKGNREIIDKSKRIETLTEDNAKLSREIADLNRRIADYVSGESYCVAVFEKYNEGDDVVNVSITNEGSNPLYELSVTFHDLNRPNIGRAYRNLEEAQHHMRQELTVSLGILPPKRGRMFQVQWPFFKLKSRNFNITFSARNGMFTQYYRAALVDGQWKTAIRVFKDSPEKPLYEKIEPGYPRNQAGEVEWDRI